MNDTSSRLSISSTPDDPETRRYVLKLYIAGATPNSLRAVANLTALCEEHLHDNYQLEVIDIHAHPERTADADVIAAPTLIRQLPEPIRTLIGDMSNKERVLMGLEIGSHAG